MLFWNVVADGDGVGEGLVACDAGATISSSAATAAKTAPTTFSSLPRRLCDRPLGVLLKMKPPHGGGVGCAVATAANSQGDGVVLGAMRWSGRACDIRHPAWPMLQLVRGNECRREQA